MTNTAWEAFYPMPIEWTWGAYYEILKRRVSPFVRGLERGGLVWHSFLVHDRKTGLIPPYLPSSTYVHLRFILKHSDVPQIPLSWYGPVPATLGPPLAPERLVGGSERAWQLIGAQSAWFLDLVDSLDEGPDAVEVVRQYMHYFANMAQMQMR